MALIGSYKNLNFTVRRTTNVLRDLDPEGALSALREFVEKSREQQRKLQEELDASRSVKTWPEFRDTLSNHLDTYSPNDLLEVQEMLSRKLKEKISEQSCVACKDAKPRMCASCGHIPYCESCYKQAKPKKCPVCSKEADIWIKTFV